jgi:hypothetical protein
MQPPTDFGARFGRGSNRPYFAGLLGQRRDHQNRFCGGHGR